MAGDSDFRLRPGNLSLPDLYRFRRDLPTVALDPSCRAAIDVAAGTVADVVREHRTVYGVNTGFGSLAKTRIGDNDVAELQRRLVRSHACGVGEPLPARTVRLILLLKVGSLARGHSGVRHEVIDTLLAVLNAGAVPIIPAKGSVGASGDLAPLAHLAQVLIGEGEIDVGGEVVPGGEGLRALGIEPLTLAAKEGLALLNGSQVSTALALEGLFRAWDATAAALVAGAMSVDAALGSDMPFDWRIQAVRGQPGQIVAGRVLADLLADSGIRASHVNCERVQDPYCLRCQPQVMGAALDVLQAAAGMLAREANAVSDNPLVFPEEGDILSGGNFHAEPVALAADMIALAVSEIAALSERRIAMLTDSRMSELPPFLTREPGLNSGFMIAQVTAAALASETKQMAAPASIDSLPTSANQEDHVSMATHGARRLGGMTENLARVVAIELLAAAQGIDLRRPLESSRRLETVHARLRQLSAAVEDDRSLAPDIEHVARLVESGWFGEELIDLELLPGFAQ